jgi:hypothetical protein
MAMVVALAQNSSRCECPTLQCAAKAFGLFTVPIFVGGWLVVMSGAAGGNAVPAAPVATIQRRHRQRQLINPPDCECCIQYRRCARVSIGMYAVT